LISTVTASVCIGLGRGGGRCHLIVARDDSSRELVLEGRHRWDPELHAVLLGGDVAGR
jgi:hypothetical protein